MKFKLLTLITLVGFVTLEAKHENRKEAAQSRTEQTKQQKSRIRKVSDWVNQNTSLFGSKLMWTGFLPSYISFTWANKGLWSLYQENRSGNHRNFIDREVTTLQDAIMDNLPAIAICASAAGMYYLNSFGRKLAGIKDDQTKETESTEESSKNTETV